MSQTFIKFLLFVQKFCCCCIENEQTRTRELYNIYASQLSNGKEVEMVRI